MKLFFLEELMASEFGQSLFEHFTIASYVYQSNMSEVVLLNPLDEGGAQYILKVINKTLQGYLDLKVLASIVHPGIIPIQMTGETDNYYYVVKPYLEGDTLSKHVETQRLSEVDAVHLTLALSELLEVLHAQTPSPVILRDLKPDNIIIMPQGPILIDLESSRLWRQDSYGRDTVILGTPGFAAPEQYGARETDPRSDLYSLGVLFFYCMTGEVLKRKEHVKQVLSAESYQRYGKVIEKATAFDPDQRYESVAAFRNALSLLLFQTTDYKIKERRYSKWRIHIGIATLVLCVGSIAYGFGQWQKNAEGLNQETDQTVVLQAVNEAESKVLPQLESKADSSLESTDLTVAETPVAGAESQQSEVSKAAETTTEKVAAKATGKVSGSVQSTTLAAKATAPQVPVPSATTSGTSTQPNETPVSEGYYSTLKIVDWVSGEPSPDVEIHIGGKRVATTDTTGVVIVGPYPSGKYEVILNHPSSRSSMRYDFYNSAGDRSYTFQFEKPDPNLAEGYIEITLRDEVKQTPIAGVEIWRNNILLGTTDAKGVALLGPLRLGTHSILLVNAADNKEFQRDISVKTKSSKAVLTIDPENEFVGETYFKELRNRFGSAYFVGAREATEFLANKIGITAQLTGMLYIREGDFENAPVFFIIRTTSEPIHDSVLEKMKTLTNDIEKNGVSTGWIGKQFCVFVKAPSTERAYDLLKNYNFKKALE